MPVPPGTPRAISFSAPCAGFHWVITFAANGYQTYSDFVLESDLPDLPSSKAVEGQTLLFAGEGRLEHDLGELESAVSIALLPTC